MADDVTLLPCPFCGAPAELGVREWPGGAKDYWVWCSRYSATDSGGCFAMTREHQDPDNAIAAWNTRVPDPRIAAAQERVAELEAELAAARRWSSTLADAGDDVRAELREAWKRIAELEGQVALLTAALANAEGNPETWTAT